MVKFLFLVAFLSASMAIEAEHAHSFYQAKKMAVDVYYGHEKTFYCDCAFNGKTIDPGTCGLKPRKNAKRSGRLEWEHIVPAWHIGHQLQCWQKGGRKNCRQNDSHFVKMTSDLHNLVPSVGELNGDRSNYRFSMLESEKRAYGRCDFEVDFKLRKVEPKPDIRGDIARIYLYMSRKYGLRLSRSQYRLFEAWNNSDPVSEWELRRNKRIKIIQGNGNCFITRDCKLQK